jgi:hypothetical protein
MIDIDLVEIARGAVFVAIDAGLADTGATAFDHVSQDTDPPFVKLGDIEWVNEGGKDDLVLKLSIDVVTIYRGGDRAELLAIMHANFLALHGATLSADDVELSPPELLGGSASGPASDGVTYAGLQTFELYAEPA